MNITEAIKSIEILKNTSVEALVYQMLEPSEDLILKGNIQAFDDVLEILFEITNQDTNDLHGGYQK